jgi:hypothetical protein
MTIEEYLRIIDDGHQDVFMAFDHECGPAGSEPIEHHPTVAYVVRNSLGPIDLLLQEHSNRPIKTL